jgi:hypothetical protein
MQYRLLVRLLLVLALLIVLVSGAIFVWPTMWRFDHLTSSGDTFPIRIHRITGRTEILLGVQGWVETGEASKPSVATEALVPKESLSVPIEELAKLDGNLSITHYGWIHLDIYNGTARRLRQVQVRVVVSAKDGTESMNREYAISTADGESLSSFRLLADCGCRVETNQALSWSITGATWWP